MSSPHAFAKTSLRTGRRRDAGVRSRCARKKSGRPDRCPLLFQSRHVQWRRGGKDGRYALRPHTFRLQDRHSTAELPTELASFVHVDQSTETWGRPLTSRMSARTTSNDACWSPLLRACATPTGSRHCPVLLSLISFVLPSLRGCRHHVFSLNGLSNFLCTR